MDLVACPEVRGDAVPGVGCTPADIRALAEAISRPILAVAGLPRTLSYALLAYDASPTSNEALFVSAHMTLTWDILLTVLTVREGRRTAGETLDGALSQLVEYGIDAEGVFKRGSVSRPNPERSAAA